MTKYELLKLLEPFDDDTPIVMHAANQEYNFRVFYNFQTEPGAQLLLSVNKPNREKTVELK